MPSIYHIRENVKRYISVYAFAEWIRQLRAEIDAKILVALFINYLCLKGAMYTFVFNTMLTVYKLHNMEGTIYQLHFAVALAPWAMKGLAGAASDTISIKGYKKRNYQIFVSILGFLSALYLYLTSLFNLTETLVVPFLPLPFFFIQLQIATCDLLCEGRYAAIMRETNVESKLVTFVWVAVQTGSLFATLETGWLLDYIGPQSCFFIMIILAAIPLWPWTMNYLLEEQTSSDCVTFDYRTWFERRKWFMFAILMTSLNAIQIAISLTWNSTVLIIYVLFSTTVCCAVQFHALPTPLAKVNLFMFSVSALYINLQGATDYWYTSDSDCVPNGPDFSFTYYQTVSQSVGICASLIGLWFFQTFLHNTKFRTIFFLATILKCLASITDLIIVMRWNLMLGIPDKFLYLLGDSIVYPIVSMAGHMPSVILTCKLCPKNVESTAYSLLCAFGNYGAVVSRALGVFLLDVVNVHLKKGISTGDDQQQVCTFENLPILIIFGHCILPIGTMILAKFLIPDARLQDDLDYLMSSENEMVELEQKKGASSPADEKNVTVIINYEAQ